MNKKDAIDYINKTYGGDLNNANTSFASISISKYKTVWWANIPLKKFNESVHLLFNDTDEVIWIELPKSFEPNLSDKFKIRPDINAVDIEVWAVNDEQYMKDVKSGATGFDFKPFIKEHIIK